MTPFHCERPEYRPGDRSWVTDALCQGANPDIFFPSRDDPGAAKEALAWCEFCPVLSACLADALLTPQSDDWGIRGGKTEPQRRRMRHSA